ncbi:hypothetical protein HDU91_002901 [Kappamyces sp. JEL0680]|nr:hypothetical protein HDU91_002901 [Kappamyces sp. JEL0680]
MTRHTGRVLVISASRKLLLFQANVPNQSGLLVPTWFTVGGRLEDQEGYHDAAKRELMEETGLDWAVCPLPIWTMDATTQWGGVDYHNIAEFFVSFDPSPSPQPDQLISTKNWTDLEQNYMVNYRWFSLSDLLLSGDDFIPPNLPRLYQQFLADDMKWTETKAI